jgi:preprotein translocase subunit SecE
MAQAMTSGVAPLLRELLSVESYKRSQGRVARQATFWALIAVVAIGAWRLSDHWALGGWAYRFVAPLVAGAGNPISDHWLLVDQFVIPGIVLAVGSWIAFRLVNMPRCADCLIAVEAEMNKVSWPTRGELVRSSLVVLITIFVLGAVLFAYDVFWRNLLQILGIVGG